MQHLRLQQYCVIIKMYNKTKALLSQILHVPYGLHYELNKKSVML